MLAGVSNPDTAAVTHTAYRWPTHCVVSRLPLVGRTRRRPRRRGGVPTSDRLADVNVELDRNAPFSRKWQPATVVRLWASASDRGLAS